MKTLLAILTAAVAASGTAARADAPALLEAGTLRWACGGIGADERRALAAAGSAANLEILLVTARRGAYLAGAELAVYARAGPEALLQVGSAGPLCYIDTPPGDYRIVAKLDGVTREASVRVARQGGARTRAVLAFPDEPWDGIRASEEEKRQAREP